MNKPDRFAAQAAMGLKEVSPIMQARGAEYGDPWETSQWTTLRAVSQRYGLTVSPQMARLLAAAALVDIKHERNSGGFKEDNLVDGVAYSLNLIGEVKTMDRVCKAMLPSELFKDTRR